MDETESMDTSKNEDCFDNNGNTNSLSESKLQQVNSQMTDCEDENSEKKTNSNADSDSDDEEDADEAEVKVLESWIAQNPYDYASHVALIAKLQKMGELERLRTARENMNAKYPMSPELWLSWMKDEIKLATTPEQKADVVNLCERAVNDYLSIEVWLEYLQFSIGNMGMEKDSAKNVRQLFERALTAAGLHTIKGAIIWEAFREFEIVLFALVDPTNQAEKKEQLDRIGNLFRRQLACPLLDMEKTFEQYESWRTGDGAVTTIDSSVILSGYNRALKMLNARLPFEEKTVSAQGDSQLLDAYKAYLLHEKQNGDPGRVTVLYERAVTDVSLEASLWIDYLTYLEMNIKIESVLEQVYHRASRNVPWCSTIWQKWIRSYEKWNKSLLEVQSLLENALSVGLPTAEDYRNIWIVYLEYLRRRMDQYPEEQEKQIDIIRNAFNRACEHLAKTYGLDGDPNCIILQYWARTEAIHASNMEKARTLWSDILSQGHSITASYWLEYIALERCYGDTKHLRKLYQKALTAVKDWPESVVNSWIDFERDEGTLEQMEICESKTKEKLEKVAEERQRTQQTTTAYETSPTQNKKITKRKSDDSYGKWKNLGGSLNKLVKVDSQAKVKLRESRLQIDRKTEDSGDTNNITTAPASDVIHPDIETMEVDRGHNMDDKLTVFVSNLDYTATEEDVRNTLEPAGPITLFKMIKDYKGRSKGFCYVQLVNEGAVEEALKLDRTSIRGRPMFVSRCDPDKAKRSPIFKYSSTLEKNKLFVKGLPVTTTKEELEEIYKVYGTLKEVRLVTYRNGHSKGLAYVEFEDEDAAAKALFTTDGMKINGKIINVAISQPPERKKCSNKEVQLVKSLGGTTVSRTTFGMPKTLLSMIPRTVKTGTSNGSASTSGNGVSQTMSNQDFRSMFLNKM